MEVWAFGEILDWRYFDFWRENIRPYVYFALRILGEKRLLFKHHCGGFQKRGKELVLPAAILFSCGKSPLFVICKRFLIDVYIRALHQRGLQKIGRDTLSFVIRSLWKNIEEINWSSLGKHPKCVALVFATVCSLFFRIAANALARLPWHVAGVCAVVSAMLCPLVVHFFARSSCTPFSKALTSEPTSVSSWKRQKRTSVVMTCLPLRLYLWATLPT